MHENDDNDYASTVEHQGNPLPCGAHTHLDSGFCFGCSTSHAAPACGLVKQQRMASTLET